MCMCDHLLQLCPILCNPMNRGLQAPLSMGLSRQEYWSVLPCPPPGDLPNLGIKPVPLDFLSSEPPGSLVNQLYSNTKYKV